MWSLRSRLVFYGGAALAIAAVGLALTPWFPTSGLDTVAASRPSRRACSACGGPGATSTRTATDRPAPPLSGTEPLRHGRARSYRSRLAGRPARDTTSTCGRPRTRPSRARCRRGLAAPPARRGRLPPRLACRARRREHGRPRAHRAGRARLSARGRGPHPRAARPGVAVTTGPAVSVGRDGPASRPRRGEPAVARGARGCRRPRDEAVARLHGLLLQGGPLRGRASRAGRSGTCAGRSSTTSPCRAADDALVSVLARWTTSAARAASRPGPTSSRSSRRPSRSAAGPGRAARSRSSPSAWPLLEGGGDSPGRGSEQRELLPVVVAAITNAHAAPAPCPARRSRRRRPIDVLAERLGTTRGAPCTRPCTTRGYGCARSSTGRHLDA